jgi:tetratricopeptide (TPR) repeat protein
MAANRLKTLRSAEELLKQGKTPAALRQLEGLGDVTIGDALGLNRVADLLARGGNTSEAVHYYGAIAERFSDQGFYPKAVAIHKKILRLEKDHPESLLRLGELYLNQKLPGEARNYLLRAAEGYLAQDNRVGAREVYERLAAAEPHVSSHRVRLAELRAGAGETDAAGEELIELAERLLEDGVLDEAEQAFRRAGELLPDRTEPFLGIAGCLTASGKAQEALELLESRAGEDGANPALAAEIALRYEMFDRHDDAIEQLRQIPPADIPVKNVSKLFAYRLEQGDIDTLWKRADTLIEEWSVGGGETKVSLLLGQLGSLEQEGHIPALQRLYERAKSGDDRTGMADALERLVRAYEKRTMHDEASLMMDELRAIAPKSALVGQADATPPLASEEATRAKTASADAAAEESEREDLPIEVEAPAVPLNRADEEFVTGRLTQAEILEKYGLKDQALEQVRDVIARFPGHVDAAARHVDLLRGGADAGALTEALIALALARRAVGLNEEARDAASEAQTLGVEPERRELLERMGLIAPPIEELEETSPAPQVAEAIAAPAPAPSVAAEPRNAGGENVLVIDLDAMDDAGPEEEIPAAEPASPAPSLPEAMRAIEAELEAGRLERARALVLALRDQEHRGPEIDALELKIANAALEPAGASVTEEAQKAESDPFAGLEVGEDDDLSTITSALESELFAEEAGTPSPEAADIEDLGQMFQQFKEHVDREVGSDDHRTHYDLGIAYKEMGLIDEAIQEFRVAVETPDLAREASVMLGICYRDREEPTAAAEWYRKALAAAGDDVETSDLRYDLAEVLLKSGEPGAALDTFRTLLETDPSFRDVRERIAELESRAEA